MEPSALGRRRILAVLLGTTLAGTVLGLAAWFMNRPRSRAFHASSPGESTSSYRPILDEAKVKRYFEVGRRALEYDPLAYVVNRPSPARRWDWPEHPDGYFVRHVNDLGLNEEAPTEVAKNGLRVLVAGDSQTAGLVSTAESFCHVAERALRRSLGRQDVEVLNAGVGYTSPTCYLGMLHKHLVLQPDVFVAVLFTGNDFLDESSLAYAAGRAKAPIVPAEYTERIRLLLDRYSGPLWQGLNQPYRWKSFPQEIELALDAVLEAYLAMKRVCDERGIRFLAVLLPTKMDVDEDDRETWRSAMEGLGLSEDDVRLDLSVGRRLLAAARAAGIEFLDPTEAMVRSEEVLYWKADYHLGVAGHALLGELLAPRLAPLLDGPRSE